MGSAGQGISHHTVMQAESGSFSRMLNRSKRRAPWCFTSLYNVPSIVPTLPPANEQNGEEAQILYRKKPSRACVR
jgi:hypothetical protein